MTPVHSDDDGTYADVSRFASGLPDTEAPDPEPAPPAGGTPPLVREQRRWRRWLGFFALGVLIGGVIAVWRLGIPDSSALPPNHPDIGAMTASASPTPPQLDEARVAELTAKVQADPADGESLRALAAEYSRVGNYTESAVWQAKLVDLDPNNVNNRLILGVAYYNDQRFPEAEQQWLTAADLDPTSPDPWYNLGFLYLSLDPPADDKTEAAWRKVIDLAPGSDIATTVAAHLDRLDTPVPGATASPTPTK